MDQGKKGRGRPEEKAEKDERSPSGPDMSDSGTLQGKKGNVASHRRITQGPKNPRKSARKGFPQY